MKNYLVMAFMVASAAFGFSSCGDDEVEPTPNENNGGNGNSNGKPDNNNGDKYTNTEKADEGKIAFIKGTCLEMDVACEGTVKLLVFNAAAPYEVTVNEEAKSWVRALDLGEVGMSNTNVCIQENTGAAREAIITYSIGKDYKKYVKIRQRTKGDVRPAEALPSYAQKDFWHRTDREKMGFYGPVSYYRDDNGNTSGYTEYYFDREGHIIKTDNGEYTHEYTYDSQGHLTYYKVTGNSDGSLCEEYFYEYNNPGKLTISLYAPGTSYLIPDLSHYRRIWYCPEAQIVDETYTFDDKGLTISSYFEIEGYDQRTDETSYHIEYNGAYPASYASFNKNGEGRGFGPVEMFDNGMLKSYTETNGSVYGYQYRVDRSLKYMEYSGAMLITHYEEIMPENAGYADRCVVDLLYNDRMELKEVVADKPSWQNNNKHITYTGYIYDKYGNWTHRERSEVLYGVTLVGGMEQTDRLISYFDE